MFGKIFNDSLSIEDIDLPLYKYGLIHRQDINNYLIDYKYKKKQFFKCNALIVWSLIAIFRWLTYTKLFRDEKYSLIFNDFMKYAGGITQFYYMMGIIASVTPLRLVYLFNYSQNSLYKWLNIIKVLKGSQTMDTVGIRDQKKFKLFVMITKSMKFFIEIALYSAAVSLVIMCATVLIIFRNSFSVIGFGILNAIYFCFWCYSVLLITTYTFLYFFITCYYCSLKMKSLNQNMPKKHGFLGLRQLNNILDEHNAIINEIISYNKFWKKYYFTMNYALIPFNLMVLQQILFENLPLHSLISSLFLAVGYLISFLVLNLVTASVNRQVSKSYKNLYKLYILVVSLHFKNVKIKVFLSISLLLNF
jgi:hypothetical protein